MSLTTINAVIIMKLYSPKIIIAQTVWTNIYNRKQTERYRHVTQWFCKKI